MGKQAWNALMRAAKKGSISLVQMYDIAGLISPRVGGNHARRGGCDERELRYIFSDWYSEVLHDMTRTEALDILVDVFNRDYVNLKSLASELEKCRGTAKRKSRSRSRSKSRSKKSSKKYTLRDILKEEESYSPGSALYTNFIDLLQYYHQTLSSIWPTHLIMELPLRRCLKTTRTRTRWALMYF